MAAENIASPSLDELFKEEPVCSDIGPRSALNFPGWADLVRISLIHKYRYLSYQRRSAAARAESPSVNEGVERWSARLNTLCSSGACDTYWPPIIFINSFSESNIIVFKYS